MNELSQNLSKLDIRSSVEKQELVDQIVACVNSAGYTIVELNDQKPWGAYVRIDGKQADRFVSEFFPGLTSKEARLGVDDAELSPKILIVAPNQRLSWQYHDRRAERWTFLTDGAYNKSDTDDEGEVIEANPRDVVQFGRGERHRLVGMNGTYVIVVEIWQHTDPSAMSDEDDIVRLADDYKR